MLGGAPYSLGQLQKALVRVFSWMWHSMPITASYATCQSKVTLVERQEDRLATSTGKHECMQVHLGFLRRLARRRRHSCPASAHLLQWLPALLCMPVPEVLQLHYFALQEHWPPDGRGHAVHRCWQRLRCKCACRRYLCRPHERAANYWSEWCTAVQPAGACKHTLQHFCKGSTGHAAVDRGRLAPTSSRSVHILGSGPECYLGLTGPNMLSRCLQSTRLTQPWASSSDIARSTPQL